MQTRVLDGAMSTVDVEERRVERQPTGHEHDEHARAREKAGRPAGATTAAAAAAGALGLLARAVELLREARERLSWVAHC
jgi:hypothetical protein